MSSYLSFIDAANAYYTFNINTKSGGTGIFCEQPGTYTERLLNDSGNYLCEFDVFVKVTNTASRVVSDSDIVNERVKIEAFFTRAAHANEDRQDKLFLVRWKDNHETDAWGRQSQVIGGGIRQLPHPIIDEFNESSAGIYRITFIRMPWWESNVPSTETHAISNPISNVITPLGRGRMRRFSLQPDAGSISRIWAGIKQDVDTGTTDSLNEFDADIDFDNTVLYGNDIATSDYTALDPDSLDYSGTKYVKVNFYAGGRNWKERFYTRLDSWNSTLEADTNNAVANMPGRYHLLMRYALTTDPGDTEIAIKAKTFWYEMKDELLDAPTWYWIKPADYRITLQTVDLGVIDIGSNAGFGYEAARLFNLEYFCLGFDMKMFGDTHYSGRRIDLIIDRMFLVPADNFVSVDFGTSKKQRNFEILTDPNLAVNAVATLRSSGVITARAPNMDSTDWGVTSWSGNNKLVCVTDGNNTTHSAVSADYVTEIVPRSERYVSSG